MYQYTGKQRGTAGSYGESETAVEQAERRVSRWCADSSFRPHNPKVAGSNPAPRHQISRVRSERIGPSSFPRRCREIPCDQANNPTDVSSNHRVVEPLRGFQRSSVLLCSIMA